MAGNFSDAVDSRSQGHAFAMNQSMRQIAEEFLERRLDFRRHPGGFASSDE